MNADAGTHDAGPPAMTEGWDREIRLPLAPDQDPAPNVVDVSLTASVTQVTNPDDGSLVERWAYNASVPGPLIRVREGDLLRVHFTNQLPEPTTIHWHGLEVPAAMDGADPEHHAVAPGATFEYEFVVPHAGTYWYHPHMNSAAQVWRGLYGALVVDPVEEADFGAEAVLVLSDVTLADGRVKELDPNDDLDAFFGHQGALRQVNGRTMPTLRVRAGSPLHLRFINAAISRYFLLGVEAHELTRIAGDSGLIARPDVRESILVVPGERVEAVLVPQGSVGSSFLLQALSYDRFRCGAGSCEDPAPLLRVEIVEEGGVAPALPGTLAEIAPFEIAGAEERTITFTTGDRDGISTFGLNGQLYPEAPLILTSEVGKTEVWTIENETLYDHPFHLHGFRFRVLEQNGVVPAIAEWKDTLNVPREQNARIAVHFDDRPGMWMLHCHILNHAEIGMMGMLHVYRPGEAETHAH